MYDLFTVISAAIHLVPISGISATRTSISSSCSDVIVIRTIRHVWGERILLIRFLNILKSDHLRFGYISKYCTCALHPIQISYTVSIHTISSLVNRLILYRRIFKLTFNNSVFKTFLKTHSFRTSQKKV